MTKILIVRLSSLGDIVHTYPMIYDIKQHVPHCQIDWLVDSAFADLVKLNPNVDNVMVIPLRGWKKSNMWRMICNFIRWRKTLEHKTYDYILDAQGLVKSAIIAKCFNGKLHGYACNSIREKLACLLYDKRYVTGRNLLAITKNRLLAAGIFNYSINTHTVNFALPNYTDKQQLPAKIATHIACQNYVVILHATSKASKKLSTKLWAELINYLVSSHNLAVILPYGNAEEKQEALQIKQQSQVGGVVVADQVFNYAELTNLIGNAAFVFGVDTGLVHLANALNKKLIAIYVATDPERTGIFESVIAKNLGGVHATITLAQLTTLFNTIHQI